MNAPIADDNDIEFEVDRASPHASAAVIDSPGRALHDARRARKLEIVRIANELRLPPATIDALERDDFEHLPSPVFVSGYIRTYARLLELDPEPLIARFRELHPEAEALPRVAPRASRSSRTTQQPGSGTAPILLTLVLLVAIAAGSYLWFSDHEWFSNGTEDQASAETAPQAPPFSAEVDPELYAPNTANPGEAEFESAGNAGIASPSDEPRADDAVSATADTSPSGSLTTATDQADLTPRSTAQLPCSARWPLATGASSTVIRPTRSWWATPRRRS
jgi:cytoskeleton protein RodZ